MSADHIAHHPYVGQRLRRVYLAHDLAHRGKEGQTLAALGIQTVAEGIETDAQFECLRTLGCELGQGYFIARPLEAERAEAFLLRDSGDAAVLDSGAPRALLPSAIGAHVLRTA